MCLHGDVFPSWDSNLGSLVLVGFFLIHLAVQVQANSCTPLSPGWATAENLVLRHNCWITAWESDPPEYRHCNSRHMLNQPSLRFEPTTYQRPQPNTTVAHGYRYCCPHTVMYGPKAQLLTKCQHSVDTNPQSVITVGSMADKPYSYRYPCPPIARLQY